MAIALVANTKQVPGTNLATSVTSGNIDTTGATLLLVWVTFDNGGTACSVSDSKGNTWTANPALSNSTVSGRLFYAANPTVGSGHNFTATALVPCIFVAAFSGVTTTSPQDQYSGSASSLAPGSITPTEDNELIFSGVNGLAVTPTAIDAGMTLLDTQAFVSLQNYSGGIAYEIQTTAAANNPTWTAAGTTGPVSAQASYKAASAGSAIKTINGLARASVKTVNGLALASMKTFNGLA